MHAIKYESKKMSSGKETHLSYDILHCMEFVFHLSYAWEVSLKGATISSWKLVGYVIFPCAFLYIRFPIYFDAWSIVELTYEPREQTESNFSIWVADHNSHGKSYFKYGGVLVSSLAEAGALIPST